MIARRMHFALAAMLTVASAPAHAAPAANTASIVDRITWGKTSESVAEAKRLGPERWLRQQLHPSRATLPVSIQKQIDEMRISTIPMTDLAVDIDAKYKAAAKLQDPEARRAAQSAAGKILFQLQQETASRSILRDLYSSNQLQEQMTWFWFNHFNVQAEKLDIRSMLGDYEDQSIRLHALGKFKDLLRSADLHPAMLRYLDNDKNSNGHINENFAREILELHTMGVGSGYTQEDVEEMARVLTGIGVNLSPLPPKLLPKQQAFYVRRGLMEFNPARHDFGEKTVLGRKIVGTGLPELETTLDALARQPATAKHISTKLALYFMNDAPPKLVDKMSTTFLRSDGDIAEVLSTLFHSREFTNSLGRKMKDPIHYTVSAVRLAYDGRAISNTKTMRGWIDRLGQNLYNRDTPDGYSLEDSAWSGPGQLTTMFEIARQAGSSSYDLFKPEGGEDQPAFPQLQNALYYTETKDQLSAQTTFTLAQAKSAAEWNALFLSSPEFLHR